MANETFLPISIKLITNVKYVQVHTKKCPPSLSFLVKPVHIYIIYITLICIIIYTLNVPQKKNVRRELRIYSKKRGCMKKALKDMCM